MLYYSFNNYEGFKEVFGMQEHGNGVKSRRNKILLAMLKDKEFFLNIRTAPLKWRGFNINLNADEREMLVSKFRSVLTMSDLRNLCLLVFRKFKSTNGWDCNFNLGSSFADDAYRFAHPDYSLDNGGLCFDGDTRSVRYINHSSNDHVYKMKSGKFLRRLIDASQWCILPEQVKVWLCEDFAERWQAYSQSKVGGQELHVSTEREDFRKIYDSNNYESDFGSCMSHDGGNHADFYWKAVKAKAAWLTNKNDKITARCIIFTDVSDEEGNSWRLAERQYSSEGDNILKRMLVDKLIAANEIDGYKQIGVDCHNATAWVANDGTSLSNKRFSIECNLEDKDILSYQDSFKWYDMDCNIAYNYENIDATYRLDETDLYFNPYDGKVWSDYYGEYIDEHDVYYVEHREDYFRADDVRWCENTQSDEFVEDCVQLANGDYAYYGYDGEGYPGVGYCEHCGEYYLEDDMVYSELLDEVYCNECADELEQEYMEEHAEKKGYHQDFITERWYNPEEHEETVVLVWDKDKGQRVVKYTSGYLVTSDCRFVFYEGDFYFGNLRSVVTRACGTLTEVKIPAEFLR